MSSTKGGNAYAYDAKGYNKIFWKATFRWYFDGHLRFENGGLLDFKMAAIFNIFWAIPQDCELHIELEIVEISVYDD